MVLAEVPQTGRRTSGLRKRHAPSAVRETEHNRDGHSPKQRKLEHPAIPPPRFWDHLSVIPLTRRALRESQRRISQSTDGQQTRNCYVCAPSHRTDANHFVQQLSPYCLGLVKRSARQGGPDLRDIRGHANDAKMYVYDGPGQRVYPEAYTVTNREWGDEIGEERPIDIGRLMVSGQART
ncbi:hypothetical protein PCL_12046 [Purpureocillium lilacinum]|uniref:Uncharacterized protein n=1 Tax=Purpureocillium lilacinum TaxID=33203 RepID=A0A2U3DPP1_PURLI|nr:hypothetical protein PCL_12046 [Purpureocillium lilacinum]